MSSCAARLAGFVVVIMGSWMLVASASAQGPIVPAPRTADGKVDLNGVYQASPLRGAWDPSPPGSVTLSEQPSLTPAARQRAQELLNRRSIDDPTAICLPSAGPRISGVILFPIQFVQTPGQVVIIYEYMNAVRIIPTDGRAHKPSHLRFWDGDSVGHWEGDTLVVDITNYNGRGWIATNAASGRMRGVLQSDALHVVERFTRVSDSTIHYQARIDDPKNYTQPWTFAIPLERDDQYQIFEYACHEGNHSIENMLGAARKAEAKR